MISRPYKAYAVQDPQIKEGEWSKLPQAITYNLCQIDDFSLILFGMISLAWAIVGGKSWLGQDMRIGGIIGLLINGGILIMKRTSVCK